KAIDLFSRLKAWDTPASRTPSGCIPFQTANPGCCPGLTCPTPFGVKKMRGPASPLLALAAAGRGAGGRAPHRQQLRPRDDHARDAAVAVPQLAVAAAQEVEHLRLRVVDQVVL